jgi:hypothetical protein
VDERAFSALPIVFFLALKALKLKLLALRVSRESLAYDWRQKSPSHANYSNDESGGSRIHADPSLI